MEFKGSVVTTILFMTVTEGLGLFLLLTYREFNLQELIFNLLGYKLLKPIIFCTLSENITVP